jgi:hypothetical protein
LKAASGPVKKKETPKSDEELSPETSPGKENLINQEKEARCICCTTVLFFNDLLDKIS